MTNEEIRFMLCEYDADHPDYGDYIQHDDSPKPARGDCYCDNCFKGRDILAVELLKEKQNTAVLLEALQEIVNNPERDEADLLEQAQAAINKATGA